MKHDPMNYAFGLKAQGLARETALFSLILAAALLAIGLAVAFGQAPEMNPPAPELIHIERKGDHAELTWICNLPDADAFQVNRRIDGISKGITVGLQKCKRGWIQATRQSTFTWTDKKLNPGGTYNYTVVVLIAGESSLESNVLTSPP